MDMEDGEEGWLVKCLRFERDSDSGMESLYVGQRRRVQRYAWGDHEFELQVPR